MRSIKEIRRPKMHFFFIPRQNNVVSLQNASKQCSFGRKKNYVVNHSILEEPSNSPIQLSVWGQLKKLQSQMARPYQKGYWLAMEPTDLILKTMVLIEFKFDVMVYVLIKNRNIKYIWLLVNCMHAPSLYTPIKEHCIGR